MDRNPAEPLSSGAGQVSAPSGKYMPFNKIEFAVFLQDTDHMKHLGQSPVNARHDRTTKRSTSSARARGVQVSFAASVCRSAGRTERARERGLRIGDQILIGCSEPSTCC